MGGGGGAGQREWELPSWRGTVRALRPMHGLAGAADRDAGGCRQLGQGGLDRQVGAASRTSNNRPRTLGLGLRTKGPQQDVKGAW